MFGQHGCSSERKCKKIIRSQVGQIFKQMKLNLTNNHYFFGVSSLAQKSNRSNNPIIPMGPNLPHLRNRKFHLLWFCVGNQRYQCRRRIGAFMFLWRLLMKSSNLICLVLNSWDSCTSKLQLSGINTSIPCILKLVSMELDGDKV